MGQWRRLNSLSSWFFPPLLRGVARMLARVGPRTLGWRKTRLVFRWQDVTEVLRRDNDFVISPINAARIEAVSGPFILGMDRSERLFAQRRAAFSAMHRTGFEAVRAVLEREPKQFLAAASLVKGRQVDIVNGYARPVAARVAAAFFGVSGPSETDLMRVTRAVFHETFLNLTGDAAVRNRGISAGHELTGWIEAERAKRLAAGALGQDVLGALIAAEHAGEVPAADVTPVLAGLLVGAIDTTATVVAHIVYEALRQPKLRLGILADIDNPHRLTGWCWEALRRRPHNPILLREAAVDTEIAGKSVSKGTRVFAATLSAMQDARVFDDPAAMRPDRPMGLYLHFGAGLHICAGRDINALQIPQLVGEVMRHSPEQISGIVSEGPFPDQLWVRLGDVL